MSADATRPHRVIERVARESFGRLVAFLASRSGDLASAQDALADAVTAALARWPVEGVPERPEAWLLTVARRRLTDRHRHHGVRAIAAERLRMAQEEAQEEASAERPFPDRRLELMFACAHPAIEASLRTPLMLQAVLGLDAARIASAFLVSPQAMSKRLARAKLRIREARVPFAIPVSAEVGPRRSEVLAAIYAAFTLGSDAADLTVGGDALVEEAIWLARTAVALLPGDAEAEGLLALLLFSHSRQGARRDAEGRFVPLTLQNPALWSEPMLAEAESWLRQAGGRAALGRYQLEAAIQAVQVDRRRSGRIDWPAIVQLYEGLVAVAPTLAARIAYAASLCEAGRPAAALAQLDELDAPGLDSYQPMWAVRAHVLEMLNRPAEAAVCFTRAAGLADGEAVRTWLLERRAALPQ